MTITQQEEENTYTIETTNHDINLITYNQQHTHKHARSERV